MDYERHYEQYRAAVENNDLAALTAYLRSLGALGSSMESLGAEPMR